MDERLTFIKLGGSLITDKRQERTPRLEVIQNLAQEIKLGLERHPQLKILLGHGSGSFAHSSAARHGTRAGVRTPQEWLGFNEVWWDARELNRILLETFHQEGLPVVSFPPSATTVTESGRIHSYALDAIQQALQARQVPVIYGDVVFDTLQGGAILSTEELFLYLAPHLQPQSILMLGQEPGVWADYPVCNALVSQITPHSLAEIEGKLRGSSAVDVTGGMFTKVTSMLALVQSIPGLKVSILSGEERGNLTAALAGEEMGTLICNDPSGQSHAH